jgi:hypothetical protein
MRSPLVFTAALAGLATAAIGLAATAGAAQSNIDVKDRVDVKDVADHPFSTDFPSGARLRMYLRSGDFHIDGTDRDKIVIHVDGRNAWRAEDMHVRLDRTSDSADLTISGGPKNDLTVNIEIPRKTGLLVRMPAGNLELHRIVGDKDVELHFGELVIDVGDPTEYSRVDASVYSGGLEAGAFGESHGGLFRSMHKEGNGRYSLRAHVGAGDLNLQ